MRRILVVLFSVLAVGVVVLIGAGDSPLDDPVARLREPPAALAVDANLFYPLSGFAVAADSDPVEAARAAVTRVNSILESASGIDDGVTGAAVREAWVADVLTIDDPDNLLCRPSEEGCLARLAHAPDAIRRLAASHHVLLDRYLALRDYTGYRTDLVAHLSMPLPAFGALFATHRLALAGWLVDHIAGSADALTQVQADLRFERGLLATADNLLVKMVGATMMADTLHVYAAMIDAPGTDLSGFAPIGALGTEARSLRIALAGEFRFHSQAFSAMATSEAMHEDFGVPRWLGAVAVRPLFKPNRSLNAAYRCWREVGAITELPAPALAARIRAGDKQRCELPFTDWVLNPVGTILVSIAGPAYDRYAARMHDLGALVDLFNLKLALRRGGAWDVEAAQRFLEREGANYPDPYTGVAYRFDAVTSTLRIETPSPHPGFDALAVDALAIR